MSKISSYSNLRIDKIKIYRFDIPLKDIFQIATMSIDKANNVLIYVQTNEGIEGWGEASSLRSIVGETQLINFAAAKELKQILIGKNPLEISARVHEMDHFLPHNSTIKSAFEMAFYDVAAKVAGLPLFRFLGGEKRQIETDLTMGIGDPAEAGDRALKIRKLGFRMIKVKLGIDYNQDLQRLANIRKAVGDEAILRIDANQGWDRIGALKNLNAFEKFDIEFCEQPCRAYDLSGMKYISDHTPIPVMADESLFSPADALEIIRQDAAPYFNIKLSKAGGILNAQKISAIAAAGERPCMVGCMSESKLGITAAAHLALSAKIFKFFDLDSHFEHAEDPIIGGVTVNNGIMDIPEEIGIGARPDLDYLKKLEEIR
ncbi:MAG: dipeptide epimerase [Calditrichia bacterium]